ncbi:9636_t:CDS:2 [Entrophospora sp. SA101]|nr:9636_t:CDS:2 [Entrophospora sp. SA101]
MPLSFLHVNGLSSQDIWNVYKLEFDVTRKDDLSSKNKNKKDREIYYNFVRSGDVKLAKKLYASNFDIKLRENFKDKINKTLSQREDTEWMINVNGKRYDIVKMTCKSFEKTNVFRLNYNEPILSYIIDFTESNPIEDNRREYREKVEEKFPKINKEDSLFNEHYFIWQICCLIFKLWNSNDFNPKHHKTFSEGSFEFLGLRSIYHILVEGLGNGVIRVGEQSSEASRLRKKKLIEKEKKLRQQQQEQEEIFFSYEMKKIGKKADFWVESIHEIGLK